MIPFKNHPRPQMEREEGWAILDGIWKAAVLDRDRKTVKEGDILVPYSPEAKKSGFGHILMPDETLIYEKHITLPFPFNSKEERIILHFDAVDWEATVYVDGEEKIRHRGGYLPFSVTLEKSEFDLTVAVTDPTDTMEQERGKQRTKRGGIWYTPQSGIWQSVWAEKVPLNHIESIRTVPDLTGFTVTAVTTGNAPVSVFMGGKEYRGKSGGEIRIDIPSPRLWSPSDPYLYYFRVTSGSDTVLSYTGLRTFGVGDDGNGVKRLLLNGKPFFHHGLLDQGYYPDGLYTPSSEEEMVGDLLLVKELGFNMLRKHIKVEPMRWYWHCDRLGILVWQDAPSGGGIYNPLVITAPLVIGSHLRDNRYSLMKRKDREMRREFEKNLLLMMDHLANVVSLAMWVPFNEGWGQFDSVRIGRMVEEKDRTRTVDYHSGWLDQGEGSFKSLHVYFKPYVFRPDRKKRCVILTEFGGYGLAVPGHRWDGSVFQYKGFSSKEELTDAISRLYREEVIPAKEKGLSAAVYTQVSDVEEELNGLVTYDRAVVKVDKEKIKELSREILA